jgi:DNA-directed RNA polymerase specialized sigma24 family protein
VTITTSSERREQISAFYARHATRLQERVRRHAHVPEQTIEDACQHAWTILVRRRDIRLDAAGFSWLATVAIREAWHRDAVPETPIGAFQGPPHDHDCDRSEPPARDDRSAEDRALERIEHTERIGTLATLKPREREALTLQGLGYSYREIARLTDSTYSAVNRRITEGRVRRGGREPRTNAGAS